MRYKNRKYKLPRTRPQKKRLVLIVFNTAEKAGEDIDCADSEIDLVFREAELKKGEGQYRQKNSGEDISCDQGAYHAPYRVCLHEKTPFLKDVLQESFRDS